MLNLCIDICALTQGHIYGLTPRNVCGWGRVSDASRVAVAFQVHREARQASHLQEMLQLEVWLSLWPALSPCCGGHNRTDEVDGFPNAAKCCTNVVLPHSILHNWGCAVRLFT